MGDASDRALTEVTVGIHGLPVHSWRISGGWEGVSWVWRWQGTHPHWRCFFGGNFGNGGGDGLTWVVVGGWEGVSWVLRSLSST